MLVQEVTRTPLNVRSRAGDRRLTPPLSARVGGGDESVGFLKGSGGGTSVVGVANVACALVGTEGVGARRRAGGGAGVALVAVALVQVADSSGSAHWPGSPSMLDREQRYGESPLHIPSKRFLELDS